jgi:hypothetical protein
VYSDLIIFPQFLQSVWPIFYVRSVFNTSLSAAYAGARIEPRTADVYTLTVRATNL